MKRPDYQPENGFLLDRPLERVEQKSDFLLRLEVKQGSKEAAEELANRIDLQLLGRMIEERLAAAGVRDTRKRARDRVVSITDRAKTS